ncbi:MAG: ATP-binding protein [Terracidiphilus sp.]
MLRGRISISLRLTIWFGVIFLTGWVLFGTAMWLNLKQTLTDERYLTLSHRIDRLETLLAKDHNEDAIARFEDLKDFAHATGGGLVEIFHRDGSRLFPSPSSAARAFPWPAIKLEVNERLVHIAAADQPYWVLERRLSLDGEDAYVMAAAPEGGNLLVLDRFWEGLIASAPILLLISSAGGYLLSRKALKPVDCITATARLISISNLSERLPVSKTGDELERLAETCNAMLARLEVAVNQIKQFTADASHELRGPLSFVRTVAEVALRNPKIDRESRAAFQDIVAETATATVLLEDMLTLARADAERGEKALVSLDLTAVVREACELARPIAEERRLSLSVSLGAPRNVSVLGDFATLRRLVWILLDNALKYTPARGSIDVALSANHKVATVQVRDSGAGISKADLPRIFDRFYRADPSRSHIEGTGLGLAIAKWIAEIHHAELSVESKENQGTIFQVVFPQFNG